MQTYATNMSKYNISYQFIFILQCILITFLFILFSYLQTSETADHFILFFTVIVTVQDTVKIQYNYVTLTWFIYRLRLSTEWSICPLLLIFISVFFFVSLWWMEFKINSSGKSRLCNHIKAYFYNSPDVELTLNSELFGQLSSSVSWALQSVESDQHSNDRNSSLTSHSPRTHCVLTLDLLRTHLELTSYSPRNQLALTAYSPRTRSSTTRWNSTSSTIHWSFSSFSATSQPHPVYVVNWTSYNLKDLQAQTFFSIVQKTVECFWI